jgi:demethylspheroidene O-methyltransferase
VIAPHPIGPAGSHSGPRFPTLRQAGQRIDAVLRAISDRLFQWRNRLFSSPRFQRWAARFPLTRPIARRRAAALFDLTSGFVYSQVLAAAVQARLFDALASGPQTLAELTPKLAVRLPPAGLLRLLQAACALDLVEQRSGDRYGLGIHGASLVGNPAVARMIDHHALLYRDLSDPIALLGGAPKDTLLRRFWSYAQNEAPSTSSEIQVAAYSQLMAGSVELVAQDILDAYPIDRHRQLLDVGGGEGAFVEFTAARTSRVALRLFELPAVAARARTRLARAGLQDRVSIVAGDMFRDRLPTGADLISLVRVLHDHDDDDVHTLLLAVRAALGPGGVLLIAEPMAGHADSQRAADAYFGFYLLAMGQGRARTPSQIRALLHAAGFSRVQTLRTRRPLLTGLLRAENS